MSGIGALGGVARAQSVIGSTYQQVGVLTEGSAVELHGHVIADIDIPLTPDRGSLLFFKEVGEQHATEMYMQLLDAPVISAALAELSAVSAALRLRPIQRPGCASGGPAS
jgi:hypothetical protein